MNSGKESGLAEDRSDLVAGSGVGTYAVVQDHVSDGFLGDVVKDSVHVLGTFRIDLFEVFLGLNFNLIHVLKSFELVICMDSFLHLLGSVFSYSLIDLF